MRRSALYIGAIMLMVCAFSVSAEAASFQSIELEPSYDHDRWGTSHDGVIKDFRAYRSSFATKNEDDNFDGDEAWGVPEWVAYEIKRFDGSCIETHERPGDWIADEELEDKGVMPTDDTYTFSREFRSAQEDWFVRGHLAMKLHAERLGEDAAWNTHTFYNAVPQRDRFNGGIWLDLEQLTGAWAQRYGAVWIVAGPIFVDRFAYAHMANEGEIPVAIPEAVFKIVIKEGDEPDRPEVLAFIYPQIGPGYSDSPYDHSRYLTTVDEIEELTGIDFLMAVPGEYEEAIESGQASALWPVNAEDLIGACRDD